MAHQRQRPPDNHVHTHWSWDTADSSTMLRACEKAVQLGLPAIAFTEHLDFTVWDPDDRATDEGLVERHASRHAEIDVQGYF
ncbi:MAG: PHP domain-containing protein, partial [Blastococcus sp.]|nr:PHP domain-containing protein [Blastococcus sp.]